MLLSRFALILLILRTSCHIVTARPTSRSFDELSPGESSHIQQEDASLGLDEDYDDFDLEHDNYELLVDPSQATSANDEYRVHLSSAKYLDKHSQAVLRHDVAKMKKNERKRDLLINNDINGIRKLIQRYRNERFWLRLENHHHRYKCGNVGDKAKHWRLLTDALNKEGPYPSLGFPDLSEAEKRGKDAEEQATLQNQLLDYEAQWKATQLIGSDESHDVFSIDRSRAKLKGLQSMRDSRGREVNQRRLAQATEKHEHRVNALIHGKAEDAAALAEIYQSEFDRHLTALREKSVKEERVQARGIAWWRKLRELQRRAGQDAQHH